jgi:hypothetical protein
MTKKSSGLLGLASAFMRVTRAMCPAAMLDGVADFLAGLLPA